MAATQIKLYELVRNKFGEKDAETFVHLIEEKMDAKIEQRKHELATKDDISCLKDDILCLKDDMYKWRGELLRTIYVTSLGQVFAIVVSVISLMLLILKK
jgi:hypothetical protein